MSVRLYTGCPGYLANEVPKEIPRFLFSRFGNQQIHRVEDNGIGYKV